MKLFQLGYFEYDDRASFEFLHEDKDELSFNSDCHFLLNKYGDTVITGEEYLGVSEFVTLIAEKLPELGYRKLEFISCFFSGSGIIKEGADDDFIKHLGPDLSKKVLKQNHNQ